LAVPVLPSNRPPWLQRRGTTTATLTIPARTGHRRILRDVFVQGGAAGDYIQISVGNIVLNRIYPNLTQAILVQTLAGKVGIRGLLSWLGTLIPDFPYPNASEDEDITIAHSGSPTRIDAYFEDVTEGDVRTKTLPGGSLSTRHFMILNMSNAVALAADGEFGFAALNMPSGLSPFTGDTTLATDARRMAAGQRFTVYIIAGDFPSPGGTASVERVYIYDEQIMLFTSENAEGLFVDPLVVNELAFDLDPLEGFILPQPYILEPNRLYTLRGYFDYDGANQAAIGSQRLFLIGIREYIGV